MSVSVVVPVYNVKNYLPACIDSILDQTYKEIEVILVDDGSTDGSEEICDEYAQKDKRVHVIHKANGGQVEARKAGINVAGNDYIVCIDADDWIENVMLESLMKTAEAENADIITSGYIIDYGYGYGNRAMTDGIPEGVYADDVQKEFLYSHMMIESKTHHAGIMCGMCAKIMRTDLVRETINCQYEDIKYAEDGSLGYVCLLNAKKIVITHRAYYHYMQRDDSVMHSADYNFLSSVSRLYAYLSNEMKNSRWYYLVRDQIEIFITRMTLKGINRNMGIRWENTIPYYFADESLFPAKSKIVLYGAGEVGQSYYKQIKYTVNWEVVAWVDQNYLKYQALGMDVIGIRELQNVDYDYILLALINKNMAEEIKNSLHNMGIASAKIVWIEPQTIIDRYIAVYDRSSPKEKEIIT